jgi:hypothetical protein
MAFIFYQETMKAGFLFHCHFAYIFKQKNCSYSHLPCMTVILSKLFYYGNQKIILLLENHNVLFFNPRLM